MNELTDLEICKQIAEIEGLTLSAEWERSDKGVFIIDSQDDCGEIQAAYDPINDKSLCFDLMIKHNVIIQESLYFDGEFNASCFTEKKCNGMLIDVSDLNPQIAILRAIIAKNKER